MVLWKRETDFHRAIENEDYIVGLEVISLNKLAIRQNNTTYAGDLELGTTFYRNTSSTCKLMTNTSSNILWYNNAGSLIWICDATSAGESGLLQEIMH